VSKWNHRCCAACWRKRNPDGREPHHLTTDAGGICCVCGILDASGIFIRADPESLKCQGLGPEHEDSEP
jgi:hypothetical protein